MNALTHYGADATACGLDSSTMTLDPTDVDCGRCKRTRTYTDALPVADMNPDEAQAVMPAPLAEAAVHMLQGWDACVQALRDGGFHEAAEWAALDDGGRAAVRMILRLHRQ